MTEVNQQKSQVGGDQVAGNKIVVESGTYPLTKTDFYDRLVVEYLEEVASGEQCPEKIGDLAIFLGRIGARTIEQKFQEASRDDGLMEALRFKEAFNKRLDQYLLYKSAQKAFGLMLARVRSRFKEHIYPAIDLSKSKAEIDSLIQSTVICPTFEELGDNHFEVSLVEVEGMVFHLMGQCFLDWSTE